MSDITISGAALALLGTVAATLVSCISILFKLLIGRLDRAERQSDQMVPLMTQMVGRIEQQATLTNQILDLLRKRQP